MNPCEANLQYFIFAMIYKQYQLDVVLKAIITYTRFGKYNIIKEF